MHDMTGNIQKRKHSGAYAKNVNGWQARQGKGCGVHDMGNGPGFVPIMAKNRGMPPLLSTNGGGRGVGCSYPTTIFRIIFKKLDLRNYLTLLITTPQFCS